MTGKRGPSVLARATRALGAPGPGQALVKVLASGVSFAEVQMPRGRYPGQPAFPFVPGYDLVGTVVAVGAGVPNSLVGARVAALTETGAWATAGMLEARSEALRFHASGRVLGKVLLVPGMKAHA